VLARLTSAMRQRGTLPAPRAGVAKPGNSDGGENPMRNKGCLLLIVFCTGIILGASVMYYLVKADIIQITSDIWPFYLAWLSFIGVWFFSKHGNKKGPGSTPE
jgi:hypothetical protein